VRGDRRPSDREGLLPVSVLKGLGEGTAVKKRISLAGKRLGVDTKRRFGSGMPVLHNARLRQVDVCQ